MNPSLRCCVALAALFLGLDASAGPIALYPTGPARDSAYLRLVNVADTPLTLTPEGTGTALVLSAAEPVSAFIAVPGGQPLKGLLSRDGQQSALEIEVAAGDFTTVFALATGQGIRQLAINETFELPNQLKASLALFNADPSCLAPRINLAGRDLDLFQKAAPGNPRRQELNPRGELAVQLNCDGRDSGPVVQLGALQAGQRYSLLLLPSTAGPRLLAVTDSSAH